MRKSIVSSTSLAGMLLAGAAIAGGPVSPPPASCDIDEVLVCWNIGGRIVCRRANRDIRADPARCSPRASAAPAAAATIRAA